MPSSISGTSNLDVNSIVGQLMTLERKPLSALVREQGIAQSRLSAWGRLKGTLSSLQSAVKALHDPDKFSGVSVSIGDSAVASVAAGAAAQPGTVSLEVLALAQQHKVRSDPFASTADSAGSGTLTFHYGTYDSGANTFTSNAAKPAQSVAIAAGASLAGVRDAVNAANIGVSASIVNDGGGHRLVFTGKDPGAASGLKVAVSDDDGSHTNTSGLSRFAYDPTAAAGSGRNLTQTALAQDASLKLDGIALTRATNVIGDALEGLTLTLTKTNAGAPTAVTVTRERAALKKALEAFVTAYNDAGTILKELTGYNAETKHSGMLQGDAVAFSVGARLRAALTGSITALTGALTSLPQIGLAFQKDGSLALDAAKLDDALDNSFDGMAGLFVCIGKPSNALAVFKSYTGATVAGEYALNVTQAATRGTLTGSAAAGLTIGAGSNDSVTLTLDGTTATITLAAGTYASAAALAAEVQSKINAAAAFKAAGIEATVAESGGVLSVASARYGASSAVAAAAGGGATNLFGASPASVAGADVAGTINGVVATGAGRVLTGAAGDASEGLALEINATAAGSLGSVNFSRGYAHQLDQQLEALLEATGALAGRTDALNAQLKSIDRREDAVNDRLEAIERRYRAQFVALDALLARMNTTSSFLAAQLANLPGTKT